MNEGHVDGIKKTIEEVIGTDTVLKVKKPTEDDIQREKFESIIRSLEQAEVRSMILGGDMGMDFTKYDEPFYTAIDSLLELCYGKEATEVIFFYLYDRVNPDGSINELIHLESQKSIALNTVQDLWDLVKVIRSQEKPKTKRKR